MRTGTSSFWDDVRTPHTEGPAEIWGRALRKAGKQLREARVRRLDELQQVVFPHAFHGTPLLGRLFDVGPIGIGGSSYTPNVAKTEPDTPQRPIFVPTYRVVFTPGDWANTRGSQPLGQSGHRFSPFRRDQLDDWIDGSGHRWLWGGPPKDQVLGRMRLTPAGQLR